jgi:hypothetical protein
MSYHGLDAKTLISRFNMQPHPEGGWYAETFRDDASVSSQTGETQSASSAIYFLLEAGDLSHWHRVHGSAEIWFYHAGAPLSLTVSPDGHDAMAYRLGMNISTNEQPQLVVPAGWWQTATSLGEWTFVSCTVAPAFSFDNFELAEPDWRPTPRPASGS